MKMKELDHVINNIKYKDWRIGLSCGLVDNTEADNILIWVEFEALDVNTGKMEMQVCRRWYVESNSEPWQIVDTVFKAIKNAEEHEVKEQFYYEGVRVFDPHKDFLKGDK